MALEVGSRLGHYDVTALIGEGGMGQVYQATDTKLKRQVALKILPEAFSADPERLARFQREAEVLQGLFEFTNRIQDVVSGAGVREGLCTVMIRWGCCSSSGDSSGT